MGCNCGKRRMAHMTSANLTETGEQRTDTPVATTATDAASIAAAIRNSRSSNVTTEEK